MPVVYGQTDQILSIMGEKIGAHPEVWLGPRIVALGFSWMFLGILFCQVERYFKFYPTDPLWIKVEVVLVVIASILKTCEEVYVSWQNVIVHAGDFKHAAHISVLVAADGVWAHLVTLCATAYFLHRCWVLTDRNWIILGVLVGMETGVMIFAILLTIHYVEDPYYFPAAIPLGYPYLTLLTAVDALISIVVTWKLLKAKKGFNRNTDQLMNKLIRLTWEAALPPALVQIINMILYEVMGDKNLVFSAFVMIIPRLYVFSFMYTLNVRGRLRLLPGTSQGDSHLTWAEHPAPAHNNKSFGLSVLGGRASKPPFNPATQNFGITIHTETIAHVTEPDQYSTERRPQHLSSFDGGSYASSSEEEKTTKRTEIGRRVIA